MRFRDLSEEAVLETGTAIAVLGYSILSVLLLPYATQLAGADTATGRILAILTSAVALYFLIHVTVSQLVKYWARPVLGRWVYRSSSGTFAMLYLEVEKASLHYRVDVYPSLGDVLEVLDGDPRSIQRCVAHAYSTALSYRNGVINLIYRIERTADSYAPREGVLTLELMPGGMGMKGYWHSNVEGESARGTLDIFREEPFREIYGSSSGSGGRPSAPEGDGGRRDTSQPSDSEMRAEPGEKPVQAGD